MPTQLDNRQVVQRSALSMIGNAANEALSVLFPRIDAEMAKLFEDRNVMLTDGGTITFTGTQVQFSESLKLTINQKISGAVPQVIDLGSGSQNFTNNGDMMVAVVNRTAGTASVSIVTAGNPLAAVTSANQEVFLIAKRVDAGDGTQRLYWRNGSAFNAGQTARLGSAGSGGTGSGVGDDLDSLLYRASFTDLFAENASNANSSINSTGTNATFNAAKSMYTLNYDASKTITTTGTSATLSGTPSFTVAAGDIVISGGVARKIASISSQTAYTLEAAFPSNLASAAACVSQAVYTKDIYNLAVDGAAISSAFGAATFSDALIDYKDNATSNSNIFTPNTTPFVAFSASVDNSTFTTVGTRNTNETDTENSTTLPAAGTSLYIRFFSNKTSGTGFVNLIMYKAFMQKTTAATAGGITNSAYAFTNGVGTPVNCSTSVVGGKTVVTLTWQYALGVYSGTSASSIEVWLNGQKLPRFINATLTPDASFLETSSTSITLDRDYSSQNLSIEVFQRTQIVDNSTINTTNIAYQQEIMQNGFQGFVAQNQLLNATATTGTPAAGTFYSSITGRAAIADLSQDLKPRMGIERIMTEQLFVLQNEFGSNGEQVWGVLNDLFGQIRLVGTGGGVSDSYGNRIHAFPNDYVEITFYGTGLNILCLQDSATRQFTASVDGGSQGSNLFPASGSSVLGNRNYGQNTILPVVANLALGIHTVKILSTGSGGQPLPIYGFEIINDASTIKTPPGVSYVNGSKLVSSSLQSVAYNSAFDSGSLGTRGGRVVFYQKSDGTLGKAVTSSGSQLNLTSADHTNEEMSRVHYWREFAAGRSDDFSSVNSASLTNVSFTLDDGTTSLVANQVNNPGSPGDIIQVATSGTSYVLITFVGTGLDILQIGDGSTTREGLAISVDGTSVGSISTYVNTRIVKLVSGLAYGTHTVRIARSVSGNSTPNIAKFFVYQPKKPTLPSGAVELADYNVMATFSPNTTQGQDTTGAGVLWKSCTREFTYVGTWSAAQSMSHATGWRMGTSTNGDYLEYTFFGTGFEMKTFTGGSDSNNVLFSLQNLSTGGSLLAATTTNFATLQSAAYGGTFTNTTGIANFSGAGAQMGVSVYNLPLALYKVRMTNQAALLFQISCICPIVPLHSVKSNLYGDLQNTLPVGSNSISDNRKITPVKDALPAVKAWAQAVGITSAPTTTSTIAVPMPDMSVTIKTNGSPIQINFGASMSNASLNGNLFFQAYIDGVATGSIYRHQASVSGGYWYPMGLELIAPVSPGAHKVDIYWWQSGGTAQQDNTQGNVRTLTVKEI